MQSPSHTLSPRPSSIALAIVVLTVTAKIVLVFFHDAEFSTDSGRFWELMLGSVWSWWVYVNRKRLGQRYPFEFDALVFFAWPIVVPYYLVKSRDSRRKSSALSMWALYAFPFVVAAACYAISPM